MTTPTPFFPGQETYPSFTLFPTTGFGNIGPIGNLEYMQYEIDGFKFGGNPLNILTDYLVENVDFGDPDITIQDTNLPLEDGAVFGRDYKRGRTITFTMNIITSGSATEALSLLSAAWDNENIRRNPGATSILRWNRHGRTSRVYGRPRRFAPVTGKVDRGWVPVLCDFRTIDHLYYGDTELSESVSIIPPAAGGWVMPFTFPVTPGGTSTDQGKFFVGGTKPAWLTSVINGPILNPKITILGLWEFQLLVDLSAGEFVKVSTPPWERHARRNGTINVRGSFTQSSIRMSDMKIPPGNHKVVLSGIDPTGTASLTVLWREARTSF